MCGIFGFVGRGMDVARLQEIAIATEAVRGGHAYGFAWIDADGRMRHIKGAGRIADNAHLLEAAWDAQMLVGHVRLATHGSTSDNANNHPHSCDGGWIVHNGVIPHFADVAEAHGLILNSECDSEVIARLVETSGKRTYAERMEYAASLCASRAYAAVGLWKPGVMVIARDGNPLHWVQSGGSQTYVASLAQHLVRSKKSRVFQFHDEHVTAIRLAGDSFKTDTPFRIHRKVAKEAIVASSPTGCAIRDTATKRAAACEAAAIMANVAGTSPRWAIELKKSGKN